jgi:hypothetical protein
MFLVLWHVVDVGWGVGSAAATLAVRSPAARPNVIGEILTRMTVYRSLRPCCWPSAAICIRRRGQRASGVDAALQAASAPQVLAFLLAGKVTGVLKGMGITHIGLALLGPLLFPTLAVGVEQLPASGEVVCGGHGFSIRASLRIGRCEVGYEIVFGSITRLLPLCVVHGIRSGSCCRAALLLCMRMVIHSLYRPPLCVESVLIFSAAGRLAPPPPSVLSL